MPAQNSIIAMIPARIGSTRLKVKNLALLNGKPMIAYAIAAAKESGIFDKIVLNSDSSIFQNIAERYDIEFYDRPQHLGSSTTKSDDVVLDFIQHHPADIVAWVNSISPLQTGKEIRDVINYFLDHNLDSLITVKNEQVHCVHKGEAVNFNQEGKFAQTQDLIPVQSFVYSIMMWKTKPFAKAMREKNSAFFTGKVGYYPVSKLSAIIIKTEEDLRMADYVLKARTSNNSAIEYDEIVTSFSI